jgi:hypothetical protein
MSEPTESEPTESEPTESVLGDRLRRAAGIGGHAYNSLDVRTAVDRRRTSRRAAGALALVAVLGGGFVLSTGGDSSTSPLETIDQPDGGPVDAPTTTTTSTTTTTTATTAATTPPPVSAAGVCGNLQEGMTPAGGTTADFDGDGVDDPLWTVPDAEETWPWFQVELSSDGSFSEPLHLRFTTYSSGGGLLDAADIDGDGREEGFVGLGGNTGGGGAIIELEGCSLREVQERSSDSDQGLARFEYLIWTTGNSCGPTGCAVSVVCRPVDDEVEIVLTTVTPLVSTLDPEFDPETFEGTPRDQLDVEVRRRVYVVNDGLADLRSSTVEVMTLAESITRGNGTGLLCSPPLEGGEACGTGIPFEMRPVDGWNIEYLWAPLSASMEVSTVVRWTRESDGAVVDLQNPGRIMVGDGDMGDVMIAGRPGRVASIAIDSRVGPHMIIWEASTERPSLACERWTFVTAEVGPIGLTEFAAQAVGAGPVDWYYDEPAQYLTDDEVLALGETFLDQLLDWTADAGPPPSAIGPNSTVDRYLGDLRLSSVSAEELFESESWVYLDDDGGRAIDVLGVLGAVREWDLFVDSGSPCSSPGLEAPSWPPSVHRLTFRPARPGEACGVGDIDLDLFLFGDGTVHTIRVDSFEP